MEILILLFLTIGILPTLFGLFKKRINKDTFNYIITGKIKHNDSSIALLLNIAAIILSPIILFSFVCWAAAFYFIIRNRKTDFDYYSDNTEFDQAANFTTNDNPQTITSNYRSDENTQTITSNYNSDENLIHDTTDTTEITDNINLNLLSAEEKGRYEYKCVAAPSGLKVKHKKDYDSCIRSYADIVDKESVGGWKLYLIQPVPVSKRVGFIARLFGVKEQFLIFNMLIFQRILQ